MLNFYVYWIQFQLSLNLSVLKTFYIYIYIYIVKLNFNKFSFQIFFFLSDMTKLILKNNMLILFGGQFFHSFQNDGTSLWKLCSIQLDYSKKSQQPTGWEFLISCTPKENPEDGFNKEWPSLELQGILKKNHFWIYLIGKWVYIGNSRMVSL